ncbi:hypothetical protein [Flavobacterium ginsengiterrae]|uniref:Uncharacterized protein n=1 Tax=Flavobacterium ginsengiterrae TaxID=871695 RepID=A0ABP7G609_9FLAO
MTINSFHLPAKIYRYLSINEGRLVPFEELCLFIYTYENENAFSYEVFSAEKTYQSHVMDLLLFLSDINLITLDQSTDESCLNFAGLN